MSTKTEKFDLHQWAPTDNFLREEINENFAKIDLSAAKIVAGTFTATAEATQKITLGFRPKLLVIIGTFLSGLGSVYRRVSWTTDAFTYYTYNSGKEERLYFGTDETFSLLDDGFSIRWGNSNQTGQVQGYIAFY